MDLGLSSLIDKFEEYFGKKVTYVFLTVLGLALLMAAIEVTLDKSYQVYAFFESKGQSLGLASALDWLEIVRTVILVVVCILYAFSVVEKIQARRHMNKLLDSLLPMVVEQEERINELREMLIDEKRPLQE